jgi:hypothetical protein
MTGEEILKDLFKLIHWHYALGIPDFDLQVDSFWSTDQAINELNTNPIIRGLSKIPSLLDCFKVVKTGSDFITDNFVPLNDIEILDFNQLEFEKRNRPFSYSDTEFGYLSLKKLLKIDPLSDINPTSSDYRNLIDFIATAISKSETQKVIDLLSYIEGSRQDLGLLVHKIAHTYNSLTIYSYLYYQELLQGGQIDLDHRLNYTLSHLSVCSFGNTIKYQQYFEIFDILNELNHSKDIITRFLKIYHILEYLVYRVELVNIEVKARVNRTFIREIHGLTGKTQSTKEFDIFKQNFKKIFDAEITAGAFALGITTSELLFLKDHWGLGHFDNRQSTHIAELIYKIRNSIVHNKESEFHITTTNPDDYNNVIPLIHRLIQIIEKQTFDKISSDDIIISYKNQYIELY